MRRIFGARQAYKYNGLGADADWPAVEASYA